MIQSTRLSLSGLNCTQDLNQVNSHHTTAQTHRRYRIQSAQINRQA